MNDKAAGGGAALPGRAHGAEEDGPDGQVEVGVLGDDDGIVAAAF